MLVPSQSSTPMGAVACTCCSKASMSTVYCGTPYVLGWASQSLRPRPATSGQITRADRLKSRASTSKSRPWRVRPCTQTITCGWAGSPVWFHSQ